MMRRRLNSFLLRLRYLKLLVEIYRLIGLNRVGRKLDFNKAKSSYPKGQHVFYPLTR